jgi:hypothetical protein
MSIIWIGSGRFAAAAITDPDFANVSLLLHGDGTNGSTAIIDSSSSPKTVTAVGNAQISTAQSKFGGSSFAFDGSGDWLRLQTGVADYNFGSGDFTIEAWVYRLNTNTAAIYVGQSDLGSAAGSNVILYVSAAATSDVYVGSGSYGVASPNPSTNTWAHVALCRSGGTLRSFLNGSVVAANTSLGTNSVNIGSAANPPTIGALNNNGSPLNGYIDDFRITKGVARYTAAFTPPTAPFPDA